MLIYDLSMVKFVRNYLDFLLENIVILRSPLTLLTSDYFFFINYREEILDLDDWGRYKRQIAPVIITISIST